MIFREDITNYILSKYGDSATWTEPQKEYLKVYEQNGCLYKAERRNDKIEFFDRYDALGRHYDSFLEEVKILFNVKVLPKNESPIICACGESEKFTGIYECCGINLRCNSCGNIFSAYTG